MMKTGKKRRGKALFSLFSGLIVILLSIGLVAPGGAVSAEGEQPPSPYVTTERTTLPDGTSLTATIINGPPTPPAGSELYRKAVEAYSAASKVLTVPAFSWVFGCSSVSGAMIAGYYDNNGYPNMYAGPTNGGVMPLVEDASWGTWSDGTDTYPNNPLIASHNGVDGRVVKGSIDDYWVQYDSTAQDPYVTGAWSQHSWGSSIGDYMKTSQSAYGNPDGATAFYNYTSAADKLTCSDMATGGIADLDGTYGRKLFYEARGYTVTDCYNQQTDNKIAGGFSFANYKAEIDANHPVLINLAGHSVAGVGYDDTSNMVYLHDTWDGSNHTMTWGGAYPPGDPDAMEMLSVSIVNLASNTPSTIPTPTKPSGATSDTTPTYTWTTVAGATQYQYKLLRGATPVYTKTVNATACGATTCSNTPTTVLPYAAYKWAVQAIVGGTPTGYSTYKVFTITNVPTPKTPSGTITDTTPTFSWTKIAGATQYQFAVYKSGVLKYTKSVASSACGSNALNCANTPTTVLAAGAYSWKVRAFVGGLWRAYSAAKPFTIPVPKPKAGYWDAPYEDFYVTALQNNVDEFSTYFSACGANWKITRTALAPISNMHFSFSGSFHASGTFTSTTRATGSDGLSSYYLSYPCNGYVSGGPWSYTALWQGTAQPSSIQRAVIDFAEELGMPNLRLPDLFHKVEIVAP